MGLQEADQGWFGTDTCFFSSKLGTVLQCDPFVWYPPWKPSLESESRAEGFRSEGFGGGGSTVTAKSL